MADYNFNKMEENIQLMEKYETADLGGWGSIQEQCFGHVILETQNLKL